MALSVIPTIDLSPFFTAGDFAAKKKARDKISYACSEYGLFQVVNHGVPQDLMSRALGLSKTFFEYPDEEKLKCIPGPGVPLPAGYSKQPDHSDDRNEYLSIFTPGSRSNVLPTNPPEFRGVLEEIFPLMTNLGTLVGSIISECMGVPPNFLQEYNHGGSSDFLLAFRYFPAPSEIDNSGKSEHEDGNIVTFVWQDGAGGLEFEKNGEWIHVTPAQGTIVINVGDSIQVMSNNKFKSATHRVLRPIGKSRYSYVFFYNLDGDKWVEPLPQFTTEIGEPPKYKGFFYKEYVKLRVMDRINPPSRLEDRVLTDNKFKSPNHSVLRPEGRSWNSFAFFYNWPGDKWIEPLPQFTQEIGEEPK